MFCFHIHHQVGHFLDLFDLSTTSKVFPFSSLFQHTWCFVAWWAWGKSNKQAGVHLLFRQHQHQDIEENWSGALIFILCAGERLDLEGETHPNYRLRGTTTDQSCICVPRSSCFIRPTLLRQRPLQMLLQTWFFKNAFTPLIPMFPAPADVNVVIKWKNDVANCWELGIIRMEESWNHTESLPIHGMNLWVRPQIIHPLPLRL